MSPSSSKTAAPIERVAVFTDSAAHAADGGRLAMAPASVPTGRTAPAFAPQPTRGQRWRWDGQRKQSGR
jgi:hypothetical protein